MNIKYMPAALVALALPCGLAAQPASIYPNGPATVFHLGAGGHLLLRVLAPGGTGQEAVTWRLAGPGQLSVQDQGRWDMAFRAPRAGGGTSVVTASLASDPSRQVAFTVHVDPRPAETLPRRVDLRPGGTHPPADRHQGLCNNCYAFSALGALELELARVYGIQARLSVQFVNELMRAGGEDPCQPNYFGTVLDRLNQAGILVPWSNPHAAFAERAQHASPFPVGRFPSYRLVHVGSQPLDTALWSDADIVDEVCGLLAEGRPVILKRGGHYITLAGYDRSAPDPAAHRWIALDSLHPLPGPPELDHLLTLYPEGGWNALTPRGERRYTFDVISDLDVDLRAPAPPAPVIRAGAPALAEGQPFELVADVGGDPPVTYQWFRNGHPLPGAHGAVLQVAAARAVDAGQYAVRAANPYGDALSAEVRVTVTPAAAPELRVEAPRTTVVCGARLRIHSTFVAHPRAPVHWSASGGRFRDAGPGHVTFVAPDHPGAVTLTARAEGAHGLSGTLTLQVKSPDVDGDGRVDLADLARLAAALGTARGDAHYNDAADLDGDGRIDALDAALLLDHLDRLP